MTSDTPLSRHEVARLVANDLLPGSFVNLGIGQPTLVSNFLRPGQGITLQTENGMLGMGSEVQGDDVDSDLINAGKVPVAELLGASYFDNSHSFNMIRGGHIDTSVIGAFQVSASGTLANWHTAGPDSIPAVGGAMDLAIGAKEVWVIMTLFDKSGKSKLVEECEYPITALECVSRIYTDFAVFLIGPHGVTVRETHGITLETLKTRMTVALCNDR